MKHTFLVILLGLSLLFTACSAGGSAAQATPTAIPPVIADSTITAEGRLEPIHYAEIAFSTGGVVSKVLVQEGQSVKKGDLLIQLGGDADTQFAAAKLELANAQKALNDLLHSSDEDLAQVIIDLKQARQDEQNAQEYLTYLKNNPKVPQSETYLYTFQNQKDTNFRIRTRFWKGPAPKAWITYAENDLALKQARVDDLQRTYDRMKEGGVDKDQLAVLEARLMAAKAGLASFEIIAPFDGMIAKVSAKEGGSIKPSETAVTIADYSSWVVNTTDLTEIDVVKLQENETVGVKLDALPGVELKGTVLAIGKTFSENQGDVVYEVTVLLSDVDPAMRWGMTANVTFGSNE